MDMLAARVAAIVGETQVLDDPALTEQYDVDWTGRWRGQSRLVARPASASEVSRVVVACVALGVPVVPQGGNTGLVGGAVPASGAVLLSLRRMADLGPVDAERGEVTVGAGATLASVRAHVRAAGWELGLDSAAREAATVGGAVATGAIGAYGRVRDQVLAAQAVLADGHVLGWSDVDGPHVTDPAGYDLPALLAGSEGTLAILTAVRLRLVRPAPARTLALIGVDGTGIALRLARALITEQVQITTATLVPAGTMELVRDHTGRPVPLETEAPAYVLVETADAERLSTVCTRLGVDWTTSPNLPAFRDGLLPAITAAGTPVHLDVTAPDLAATEAAVREAVAGAAPEARTVLIAHLTRSTMDIDVLGAVEVADQVTEAVLTAVTKAGGGINGGHGIGRAKARWLGLTRTNPELAAMHALKSALDPAGILNPGVLLPPR
jgi:FAD/FMN-containing dehydrogenase